MDRYAVLKIRDFRLALASKFFVTVGLQMQRVVIGWQIFRLTRDPLALGLIGLAEAMPFMVFAFWAGHHADHHEKRRIVVAAESGLFVCSVLFAGLAYRHIHSLFLLYSLIGLTGLCRSFLWPAAGSYVDLTIPKAIYSQAAGWNSMLWQVGAIVGPILGGVIYDLSGAFWAYATVAGFILLGTGFAARLSPKPPVTARTKMRWTSVMEGIRFVFSQKVIFGAMCLDMFAVLFGGAVILLPIFAERLGVGATGLGWLQAAPSVGALLMALYQSYSAPFKRTGVIFLRAVAVFGLCMVLFALSRDFLLSWVLLAASGAADNISVVIRASLVQALTPDRLRGRVSSVNGLFIGSSNEIGAFESGVAARWLGTVPSVVIGGLLTLVTVAVTAAAAPPLRRFRLGAGHVENQAREEAQVL